MPRDRRPGSARETPTTSKRSPSISTEEQHLYQTAITVAEAVTRVEADQLVLPAIQRELVWDPEQIEKVWDSLMRGYPIGSFLFWKVPASIRDEVRLYHFMTDFDVRKRHNIEYEADAGTQIIAVLDGQQRLSAMNIGLRGSYRWKLPRLHWNNDAAFPKRVLSVRLDASDEEPDAEAPAYDFRFLTDEELTLRANDGELWFKVPDARDMPPAAGKHFKWLQECGQGDNEAAFERLQHLVTMIHLEPTVSHFEETSDSLDRILNIFIRVNSGGTQLSFSDLLLSMAIAEWTSLDARKEINELQDTVNSIGQGFSFGRDRLLKAALVLGEFDNIKFRADNFGSSKMAVIEEGWPDLRQAVELAVKLIAQFGFDAKTFRAENALIPVAYFIKHRELDDKLLYADAHAVDRLHIHRWLASSFLRTGYWTGAVDGILQASRDAIRSTQGVFPLDEISEMVQERTQKTLKFDHQDVDALLDEVSYGSWQSLLCLQLIFGAQPWQTNASVDHLHPRSAFSKQQAEKRGISAEKLAELQSLRDLLPNLQPMQLLPNQEKSSMALEPWLQEKFGEADRKARVTEYLLDDLPLDIDHFEDFFGKRRERMKERLLIALGVED
jgi:hypothetical protein